MSLIDLNSPFKFTFDGKTLTGFEGDTLASALLRNKIRLVGRSFKYHRPRGIMGAGSEEPNALVEIHSGGVIEPNRRATMIKLFDGLEAKSQNRWPSLKFDYMEMTDWISPFLSAGFYYKTFMWPRKFWELLYEPVIRRSAGLGRLSDQADPDKYDKGFLHCDILITGAGPAGLHMALAAGRSGKRVILADEDFRLGGRLLSDPVDINGGPALEWVAHTIAELESLPNVRLMRRSSVYGSYDHGVYGALETCRDNIGGAGARYVLWRIYSGHMVLAAGATERPIGFANNDRPGIMLASAVRTYQNRYGIDFGENTALLTNNDDGLITDTRKIFDSRKDQWVTDTSGRLGLKSITDQAGNKHKANYLAVSGGWNPNVHLTCHKRARPAWNEQKACFTPDPKTLDRKISVIGSANGTFTNHEIFHETNNVIKALGLKSVKPPEIQNMPFAIAPFWFIAGQKKRQWVDVQNDVTTKDIKLAHQEGFSSVEHVKRYTTLGMATDQGRTSNVLGLAVLADATGQTIPETGTTMFRPPFTPVPIGAFGGPHRDQHFKPTRLTPSHDFAAENGATFVETEYWKRTQWTAKDNEKGWRVSVDREVLATRNSVGICDVSTLGKIDIQGADAGKFLNRVYANTFSTLKVGRCRYGLMLREDGIAMDDGTTARFSDTQFIMTTTTAKAGPVFTHLEFVRQCLYPDMDVHLISTTDQWAQYSVAGPNARKLLQKIVDPEFDIGNEAFPYMACGEITVCGGTRARLFRLSFSGELAYEISVPARYGDSLIRKLTDEAKAFDGVLYGTEALGVMRIEKGHAAGNELNGTTTALNLGLGGFVSKKKDCIGKTLSARDGLISDDVHRMVGLICTDKNARLTNGSHIMLAGAKATPDNDLGYMSSVAWSPMLERYIGLGFVKAGHERKGEILRAVDYINNNHVDVEIVSSHFFDPEGERLRG